MSLCENRKKKPQISPLRYAPGIATNLSSRPEGSWACGPPKVMKNASVQQPLSMNRRPLLVIPSVAEGSAVPRTFRGNVFSTERSVVEGIVEFDCRVQKKVICDCKRRR
jgi:hypothetical protein